MEFPPVNRRSPSHILYGTQHFKKGKPPADVTSLVSKCKISILMLMLNRFTVYGKLSSESKSILFSDL